MARPARRPSPAPRVEWLLDPILIDDAAAQQFAADDADPGLPEPTRSTCCWECTLARKTSARPVARARWVSSREVR